jgi:hypothetical protein
MNTRALDPKPPIRAIVLAVALAGLVACVATPRPDRCATPCAADAAVVERINAALRERPGIEFWQVRVQHIDDVVYLYGLVETTPERTDIEHIARTASGGRKVVNSIEIRGNRF